MNRWVRLGAAVVAMTMIANLQYGWAPFVNPLRKATGWKLSDVQWAYSIFIALETWAMPACGFLIDRHGARWLMTFAGVLCGLGWSMLGTATNIWQLYAWYAVAGMGAAMVYCGSMGIGLKWFPDKRGLAAGLIAAGFGAGSTLSGFVPMLPSLLSKYAYQDVFFYTGISFGIVIILAAQFLGVPKSGTLPTAAPGKAKTRGGGENFTSLEMMRTPHFYIMYAAMLLMGIGGLMVTAQTTVVAQSLGIAGGAVTTALSLNLVANGLGRLFWGTVSDKLGRERTMIIAFVLQAISLAGVMLMGPVSGTWFIVTLAAVFFTWGEVYVLFPSACADFFGAKNASSNYSFLYSTKGVAAIIGGGLAAMLYERTGTWSTVFYGSAVMALIAAALAFVVSRMPLPRREAGAEAAATNLQRA